MGKTCRPMNEPPDLAPDKEKDPQEIPRPVSNDNVRELDIENVLDSFGINLTQDIQEDVHVDNDDIDNVNPSATTSLYTSIISTTFHEHRELLYVLPIFALMYYQPENVRYYLTFLCTVLCVFNRGRVDDPRSDKEPK